MPWSKECWIHLIHCRYLSKLSELLTFDERYTKVMAVERGVQLQLSPLHIIVMFPQTVMVRGYMIHTQIINITHRYTHRTHIIIDTHVRV